MNFSINDTMIYTLLQQPFYGSLLSSIVRVETREVPTAGVTIKDKPILYYNPDFMATLKPNVAHGVLIHELLHLVLLHQFRKGAKDHELWNLACDAAVNQMIDSSDLPEDVVNPSTLAEITNDHVPYNKSAEEYYKLLEPHSEEIKEKIFNKRENGFSVRIGGRDYKVNSLEGLESIDEEMAKSFMDNLIKEARQAGNAPYELETHLSDIYKPPQMNWRMLLRNFLNSRGRLKYEYTYKRESRRFPGAPGKRKMSGMKVAVGVDQSGSVSNEELELFMAELKAIQKIAGSEIIIVPFDTETGDPIPLRNYMLQNKRTRNGGTRFEPVFEFAKKARIDTVIMFTDGWAPIPEDIAPKTLWVITSNGQEPNVGNVVKFAN